MALAMSNNRVAMLLVLCFFLIISTESRQLLGKGKGKPSCEFTYAVKPDDTCDDVIEDFALESEFFFSINPNINCDNLYVSQWLCVDGSAYYAAAATLQDSSSKLQAHGQIINEQ